MLLISQELFEHVYPVLDKICVECLAELVQCLSRLPLVLGYKSRILGAIKPKEFFLVLILKLRDFYVWFHTTLAKFEQSWTFVDAD